MKFEIKHRFTGAVLFALATDSLRLCLQAAVKEKVDLGGADLRDADLRGVDLRGAYLRGAYLRGADLGGAYLRDADLRGVDLGGVDLRGAYLGGADLRGAYLRDADLRGADLGGADLRDADLRGVDLRDVDIRGVDLGGVDQAAQLGQPNGWHAWTYVSKEGEQRVRIGCQDKTIPEGREYWAEKDSRREVLAALAYAEAIGKLRGWGKKKLAKAT